MIATPKRLYHRTILLLLLSFAHVTWKHVRTQREQLRGYSCQVVVLDYLRRNAVPFYRLPSPSVNEDKSVLVFTEYDRGCNIPEACLLNTCNPIIRFISRVFFAVRVKLSTPQLTISSPTSVLGSSKDSLVRRDAEVIWLRVS